MYIIMYKYSTFKIKRKSFRSCMSKNFTVILGLTGDPSCDLLETKSRPSAEATSGTKRMISIATYFSLPSLRYALSCL